MNRDREVYADPVELPEDVFHGESRAYNGYGCRCRGCTKWRRMYDQVRYWQAKADQRPKGRADRSRLYLTSRGVAAFSGTFKRRPTALARLVADYLGDDLNQWFRIQESEEDS